MLFIKNRLFGLKVKDRGKCNKIAGIGGCRISKTKVFFYGDNNSVVLGDMSTLSGVSIHIHGSNNIIDFGKRNFLSGCVFCIEDNNNSIKTGEHVYIYKETEISAIESTSVEIGKDCLFSAFILIRTGDSHVIADKTTNERLNHSKSIRIAEKVWIGIDSKVLKGSNIGKECVIGSGSVVTQSTPTAENAILAGIPAKIVKQNITWSQTR